ncbi:NADPH-dependent FMN reductase [Propionicimonas sp.]|uniref:NADPH-dependent FMN reductase n=1 Tax=Propionicimonas sp. TaxID=1955623 RepID=UPI00183B22AE|nr:NADPH-dependent FMN reductase [Propionicimonas sp.]MBU3975782.1 NAD(P)H-dependent oxidoreductase [Actinomycetota bacterium]MBA3022228.1 NAD(P)H-dependent oxidoreductase [Propionicimonas sp.]MBU3987672.1 NAD(P)H-dependent oxidoreductase [Actinomycetota bacterium]MBU4007706.1 NAD(P)H-dependent oxidoreductase [Actinomycetota bacterium]MBU4065328.1 NAD(P)H-dependent oxidoreductase [Actinomycetota bacterium]
MTYRIGYLVGSLSSTSINRRLSKALIKLAPAELEFFEIGIGDLPLYNTDLEAELPAPVVALKQAVESADGLLIVSPEYNRSIPGPLKNALDWGSRPWGKNSFAGKPTAVIGASIGAIGTAVMQAALRTVLGFLDVPQLGQPEGYLTFSPEVYGEDGTVHSEDTKAFLRAYLGAYSAFVARNLADAAEQAA